MIGVMKEAVASCSLDGDTQSGDDGPPYVLICEKRLKQLEAELAELRETVKRVTAIHRKENR